MTITDITCGGATHSSATHGAPARRRGARHKKKPDHTRRTSMTWLALLAAIACDVAATYALAASHGFRNLMPSMLAVVGFLLTTYLFAIALTGLGPSISYAAFGALGTASVAVIGIAMGAETANWIKIGSLTLIIIGVALLPLADRRDAVGHHRADYGQGDRGQADHRGVGPGQPTPERTGSARPGTGTGTGTG